MLIVNDLVTYIDGCAPLAEGFLDNLDGPVHAGAEAARGGQTDIQFSTLHELPPAPDAD